MRNKHPQDLSIEEIRFLIMDRRRAVRNARLERFRHTGQVLPLSDGADIPKVLQKISVGNRRRAHRTWLDGLLLFAEFLAVIGLLAFIVIGLSTLATLNRGVAAALQQPTLAPTPFIREVVLPEGHTPPNSPGGARPNEAEVPENLRPFVQSLSNIPIPTPSSQQAIRIQIPAINVDAPVVQGDSWEQLKKGVAQHIGTPNPGERGNIVLSGHNDVFGEVFRDLDKLSPGDVVRLFTSSRQYTYIITGTQLVAPTAVEVMAPTPDFRITLISCHPYLVDVHRIIVSAILQNP